jgi:hypothetical protein
VLDQNECDKTAFIFDYHVDALGTDPLNIRTEQVFSCKKLKFQVKSDDGFDFALVQLDREVVGRTPFVINETPIVAGDPLLMLGYPAGLPLKAAGDAAIRSYEEISLTANLDAFEGNSGAPVIDLKTGRLEGVLISGEDDFVYDNE